MADLQALQQMMIEAYGSYQAILTPGYWQEMKDSLDDVGTTIRLLEQGVGFLCEHDGLVVGAVYVVPAGNPTAFFSAEWAYIRKLGVLPRYRGFGIGKALMKMCIAHARDTGEQMLTLHTAGYQSAWRIYEQLGFIKANDIGQIFGHDYWLYVLELNQHTYA